MQHQAAPRASSCVLALQRMQEQLPAGRRAYINDLVNLHTFLDDQLQPLPHILRQGKQVATCKNRCAKLAMAQILRALRLTPYPFIGAHAS